MKINTSSTPQNSIKLLQNDHSKMKFGSSINMGSVPESKDLVKKLSKSQQLLAKFIKLNEDDSKLSTTRLVQEVATNWFPKAIFARSIADLSEVSFLEFTENALVYLCPILLGEGLLRKPYSKGLDKNLKGMVSTSAADLLKEKNLNNKKLMPVKAALAISALAIPLAEYSLSYVKNIFTIKLFKKADFNNIANLNKNQKEDPEQQKRVKDSAKKHIKLAGGVLAGCLGLSTLLLTKGKNSKILNSMSEAILAPGSKFFKNSPNKAKFFNQYFGLDFAKTKTGKLTMSNGQLTACVVLGGFGYFGAAKDRGKQNFKEVLYRFPLVGFYAISGSASLDKAFKSRLKKKESYKDIFNEKSNIVKFTELDDVAKKIAAKNGTSIEAEYKRLFKQKSTTFLVPFLFGIGVMGMFVAGVSRYFTQYRYNKENEKQAKQDSFQKA